MGLNKKIQEMKHEMTRWRQKLHGEPEVAFEEAATARYIMRQLRLFGIEAHSISKTGVVGVLHGQAGAGGKAIMLRADIDALPIDEGTGAAHASRNAGVHHAKGHDGHIAMLLGAAKHLAETKNFEGTVYFVFQPAEEKAGAHDLIADGLFETFPCDAVYGLHGTPDLPLGTMVSAPGAMMAASEEFFLTVKSHGGDADDKAALISAAAEIVTALKEMAGREIPAGSQSTVAVSALHTQGLTDALLPDAVTLQGHIRTFDEKLQKKLRDAVEGIIQTVAEKHNLTPVLGFSNARPALVNTADATDVATDAARDIVGAAKVTGTASFTLDSDDFSHYLKEKPGNLMVIGTGRTDGKPTPGLYSPKYDFNDAALPVGASYWVGLVEKALPASKRLPVPAPKTLRP